MIIEKIKSLFRKKRQVGYQLIMCIDMQHLKNSMEAYMAGGWEMCGGVAMATVDGKRFYFTQAMVKYE